MTEEFLHYLWKFKLLRGELILSNGDKLEIIHSGTHNTDAGPDFFNAKLKINETLWAGNVEIHVKASEWYQHQHQLDLAYDSIILHLVYQNDAEVKRQNGDLIPMLEVKDYYDKKLYENYQDFLSNKNWIPCERIFKNADPFIVQSWLERLLIERIERKSLEIKSKFIANNNDWEESFYQILAKNLGFKLNALPFELLSKSLPVKILAKHKNSLFQLEALLFGQAGMLKNEYQDAYPQSLVNEYDFLKKKYHLQPIALHLWKYLRLRPSNFPTIRIAQFAFLIYHSQHLFSKLIEAESINSVYQLFNIKASTYFDTHYTFDGETHSPKQKQMGKYTIDLLIINTIVPMLFLYASEKDEILYQTRALDFLEQIKSERNAIIEKLISIGFTADNAFESQALLELKNNYCSNKKCLQCRIGNNLLNKG
ncbi:MAG: DUF2851 family protein [Bacteroidetes bacterium]|nr:DUF2851 family protein [Bacteroidota bacterium]